jgi:hypothetical protein
LHIGGLDFSTDQQTQRVGDNLALAAFDLLAGIIAGGPPLSVVLTDWLSMTPADGLGSRPAASRACSSSAKLVFSRTPLSRHA